MANQTKTKFSVGTWPQTFAGWLRWSSMLDAKMLGRRNAAKGGDGAVARRPAARAAGVTPRTSGSASCSGSASSKAAIDAPICIWMCCK